MTSLLVICVCKTSNSNNNKNNGHFHKSIDSTLENRAEKCLKNLIYLLLT